VSDRLSELKRQRALAAEQLAWFDREIARESGQVSPVAPAAAPAEPTRPTATIPVVDSVASVAAEAAAARAADDILSRYEKNPLSAAQDAKRGCYLWFAYGMGMLILGTATIYAIYTLRR
jgi:hypothetical protein